MSSSRPLYLAPNNAWIRAHLRGPTPFVRCSTAERWRPSPKRRTPHHPLCPWSFHPATPSTSFLQQTPPVLIAPSNGTLNVMLLHTAIGTRLGQLAYPDLDIPADRNLCAPFAPTSNTLYPLHWNRRRRYYHDLRPSLFNIPRKDATFMLDPAPTVDNTPMVSIASSKPFATLHIGHFQVIAYSTYHGPIVRVVDQACTPRRSSYSALKAAIMA